MLQKFFLILALLTLTACSTAPASTSTENLLTVSTSTSIIGDVARQIGGSYVDVHVLFPIGADPHSYEPRPQDIVTLTDAEVVLVNGFGLEETIQPLLENAKRLITVSDGIQPLSLNGGHAGESERGFDPHVWQDPNNVIVWARNIRDAFSQADPAHAEEYAANAENYIAELTALDTWIREQVAQVPEANRKLVTDHQAFGYLASRYGFTQIGAVVPALSTGASPSAQELAALEDLIHSSGVKAIFVGSTVNPELSRRVANDMGIRLVTLFTGSLSAPGGGADTYLTFVRYNVNAIVEALK